MMGLCVNVLFAADNAYIVYAEGTRSCAIYVRAAERERQIGKAPGYYHDREYVSFIDFASGYLGRFVSSGLYDARVGDLNAGDLVVVECAACGHVTAIPPSGLLQGLRLAFTAKILDLAPRMRCRACDARGKAVVSVR